MEIDLKNLQELLLDKRKKQIDIHRFSGVGEIVSGVTLFITVLTTEYDSIEIIPPIYFKCIIFVISILLIGFGIYQLILSLRNNFNAKTLLKEIQALSIENTFDIILLKNNNQEGKYLVCRNSRWRGWLFANFPVKNPDSDVSKNIESIAENLKELIEIDVSTDNIHYAGIENDRRCFEYSYGDNQYKIYRFRIYKVNAEVPNEKQIPFQLNGQSYSWMTFDEMKNNKSFMKRNVHVYDHIVRYLQIN